MSDAVIDFPNSTGKVLEGSTRIADVDPNEPIEISLLLKDPEPGASGRVTRVELAATRRSATRDAISRIAAYAGRNGFTLTAVEPAKLRVKLTGPAYRHEAAFRIRLAHFHHPRGRYRGYWGPLYCPAGLAELLEAILGHETAPVGRSHLQPVLDVGAAKPMLANRIATLYGFPQQSAAGQTVAILEFGGGYLQSDMAVAARAMGVPVPEIVALSVDGGSQDFAGGAGASVEVALDMQVVAGAAPGARLAVYFAANAARSFVDATLDALHDQQNAPSVISISWGGAEEGWSQAGMQAMNRALADAARLGVSVFISSGDLLAPDGVRDGRVHVNFPASSPWATGCGGTLLDTSGGAIASETVWNSGAAGTGGGVSRVWPLPAYQANASVPVNLESGQAGRGVPDVAADADPQSGFWVFVDGNPSPVGGTSAVAPLWAGFTALVNAARAEKQKPPVGFLNPLLYGNPSLLKPVTSGNNKPAGTNTGYDATSGYSATTGLGSFGNPNLFTALVDAE
ncbi:S53 family peptidase [Nisaea sediminum]|uniref:S53 family peptidase n=1 Tax=Nisaea sediminum TaxID=2775867 RepID=UPI001868342D|nr:S53 family peptidase [Nisaea sediminum]